LQGQRGRLEALLYLVRNHGSFQTHKVAQAPENLRLGGEGFKGIWIADETLVSTVNLNGFVYGTLTRFIAVLRTGYRFARGRLFGMTVNLQQ
jgi:hypothetical protein